MLCNSRHASLLKLMVRLGAALPLAVLLALIACLLVATSIGQLAKHLPSAGSIYTYPAEAIHPALGFLVGWGYALVEALLGPITMVLFPAAVPARRSRVHALLPGAARGAGRTPPGHLLRPAGLRPLGSPQRRHAVDRGPVRHRTRPGPFGARPRATAPVRQLVGRHAGHAVRPGPPAGPGEPDLVRQPGQHDPLGQRLRGTTGRGARRNTAGHPRARGGRLHRLPRVPGRDPGLLPQARVPPRPVAGRWSAPSPRPATRCTTR